MDDILGNRKITQEFITNIFDHQDGENLNILYNKAAKNQRNCNLPLSFECDLYQPFSYAVVDNCPSCGFRRDESKRQYNPLYIQNIIEYKLRDISKYNIGGINCFSKSDCKFYELEHLLGIVSKYGVDVNVKFSSIDDYFEINNNDVVDSIIIDYMNTTYLPSNVNPLKEFKNNKAKVDEITTTNDKINIVYELMINYNESYHDIINTLNNLIKINPKTIQVIGYDPFCDTPGEYHPQYKKDYLQKMLAILRVILPDVKIKLQYATNNNNNITENMKVALNCITGIYPDKTSKQFNADKIIKYTDEYNKINNIKIS